MSGADAFTVEGEILEAFPNGTYLVSLANGHRVRAYVAGRKNRERFVASPGHRVRLRMSPYDLSDGRILVEKEKG